jgi:hypothetical protein
MYYIYIKKKENFESLEEIYFTFNIFTLISSFIRIQLGLFYSIK